MNGRKQKTKPRIREEEERIDIAAAFDREAHRAECDRCHNTCALKDAPAGFFGKWCPSCQELFEEGKQAVERIILLTEKDAFRIESAEKELGFLATAPVSPEVLIDLIRLGRKQRNKAKKHTGHSCHERDQAKCVATLLLLAQHRHRVDPWGRRNFSWGELSNGLIEICWNSRVVCHFPVEMLPAVVYEELRMERADLGFPKRVYRLAENAHVWKAIHVALALPQSAFET